MYLVKHVLTLKSRIDVEKGINVDSGKVGKNKKYMTYVEIKLD